MVSDVGCIGKCIEPVEGGEVGDFVGNLDGEFDGD